MLSQIGLVFASCIAVSGCTNNSKLEVQPKFINTQSSNYTQQTIANKKIKDLNDFQAQPKSLIIAGKSSLNSTQVSQGENTAILYNSQPLDTGNYMRLKPTGQNNSFGNPLYELELFVNGESIARYKTVSGRYNTQDRNRNLAGTEAPLPNGKYSVARNYVAGTHSEVGGQFLAISPQFSTGRTALGIHYDPSFEKSLKNDGTSGCIGLINRTELDLVLNYIQTHQPKFLTVEI
jgi:hypothetical protein